MGSRDRGERRKERRETAIAVAKWYYDSLHLITKLRFDEVMRSQGASFLDQASRESLTEQALFRLTEGEIPALIEVTYGQRHDIVDSCSKLWKVLFIQTHVLHAIPSHTKAVAHRELPDEFQDIEWPDDSESKVFLFDQMTDQLTEPLRQVVMGSMNQSVRFRSIARLHRFTRWWRTHASAQRRRTELVSTANDREMLTRLHGSCNRTILLILPLTSIAAAHWRTVCA